MDAVTFFTGSFYLIACFDEFAGAGASITLAAT
jgi:hypothetical protein